MMNHTIVLERKYMPSKNKTLDAFGFPIRHKKEKLVAQESEYRFHTAAASAPSPAELAAIEKAANMKKDNLFEYAKENTYKRNFLL